MSEATSTCATVYCQAEGTHEFAWTHPDGPVVRERVCLPCKQEYDSRPIRPATATMPQSGYTPCACRDCPDVTVSADMSNPELCELCTDAGCEWYRPGSGEYESLPAHMRECQREDAYEGGE